MENPRVNPEETRETGLTKDEHQRLYQAEMLLGISMDMAALDTLDEILEHLVTVTARELKAERCTIFLNDTDTNELYAMVAMTTAVQERLYDLVAMHFASSAVHLLPAHV